MKKYLIIIGFLLIVTNLQLLSQEITPKKEISTGVSITCSASVEIISIEFIKTAVDSISFVSSKTNSEPDPIIEVVKTTDDKNGITFTTILHNL